MRAVNSMSVHLEKGELLMPRAASRVRSYMNAVERREAVTV
jgi:hypothetical protein